MLEQCSLGVICEALGTAPRACGNVGGHARCTNDPAMILHCLDLIKPVKALLVVLG